MLGCPCPTHTIAINSARCIKGGAADFAFLSLNPQQPDTTPVLHEIVD